MIHEVAKHGGCEEARSVIGQHPPLAITEDRPLRVTPKHP